MLLYAVPYLVPSANSQYAFEITISCRHHQCLPGAGRKKVRLATIEALRLEQVSLVPSVSSHGSVKNEKKTPAKHLQFDVGKCWLKINGKH